ncbi:hypothetical protein IJT17_10755 [bacterium]|nr:hypothetical protein [bacterium]
MKKHSFLYSLAAIAIAFLVLSTLSPAKARTGCTLDDFYWYIEDVKQNGVPRDAQIITDKAKICGGWKCLIEVDPNDKFQSAAAEYALINIVMQGNSVKLCLDPLRIKFAREGEYRDMSRDRDSIYKGKWENGGIYVVGPGNIRIKKFYRKDGHQYAIGEGMLPDGCPLNFALVRP